MVLTYQRNICATVIALLLQDTGAAAHRQRESKTTKNNETETAIHAI